MFEEIKYGTKHDTGIWQSKKDSKCLKDLYVFPEVKKTHLTCSHTKQRRIPSIFGLKSRWETGKERISTL